MNPLNEHPELRKKAYLVQWVVNGVLAVAGAYFVATGVSADDLPSWYLTVLGVGPVLWSYLGLTAQQNVDQ